MKDKTDAALGEEVHKYLKGLGIETPMHSEVISEWDNTTKDVIRNSVCQIMEALGLDLTDDSLEGTPDRIADMYVDELFAGLDYKRFPRCTVIENKMHSPNEFVLEKNIQISSTCEHHLVTIDGFANVAYIPKAKVLGLSKINRIVDFFARRPQVQERLTRQIGETIAYITESDSVGVFIDAVHYCVKSRGVRDVNSRTVTFHGLGRFADVMDPVRAEFLGRSG